MKTDRRTDTNTILLGHLLEMGESPLISRVVSSHRGINKQKKSTKK